MAKFRHEKGGKHVLDHMGDSLNFVDSGIGERLHDGRIRSYPSGHRRHLAGNQTYPGQKNILEGRGGAGLFSLHLLFDFMIEKRRIVL
jgi:hypothetical protein